MEESRAETSSAIRRNVQERCFCLAIFMAGHLVGSASVTSTSILLMSVLCRAGLVIRMRATQTFAEAGATGLNSSRLV